MKNYIIILLIAVCGGFIGSYIQLQIFLQKGDSANSAAQNGLLTGSTQILTKEQMQNINCDESDLKLCTKKWSEGQWSCLEEKKSSMTEGCSKRVERFQIRFKHCQKDISKVCDEVPFGKEKMFHCMSLNKEKLSDFCRETLF